MREFSKVLNKLLMEQGVSQAGLAQLAHMDDAKISRIINSVNRPGVEDVAALIGSFHDQQIKFRLAVAHIQDELPPDVFKRLSIHLHDSTSVMSDAMAHILRESHDSKETENMIVSFAKIMGFNSAPAPQAGWTPGAQKAVGDLAGHALDKSGQKPAKMRYPRPVIGPRKAPAKKS